MKLYHGTSIERLQDILANGLKPRGEAEGNWKKYPSLPGHVYLTTAYPFYFALNAELQTDDTRCVVFEVDSGKLDQDKFYPDEDFISQGLKDLANHNSYRDRIGEYKHLWKESLQYIGNCSYQGQVPVKAIKRYCILDFKKRAEIAIMCMDPAICIENFRYFSQKYIQLVAWLFGDSPIHPGYAEAKRLADLGLPFADKQMEYWKKQSKIREGIEVVHVK